MRPQWTTEWQAEDQLLRVESAPLEAGGRPTRLHRVVTGIAAGAGAVAKTEDEGVADGGAEYGGAGRGYQAVARVRVDAVHAG